MVSRYHKVSRYQKVSRHARYQAKADGRQGKTKARQAEKLPRGGLEPRQLRRGLHLWYWTVSAYSMVLIFTHSNNINFLTLKICQSVIATSGQWCLWWIQLHLLTSIPFHSFRILVQTSQVSKWFVRQGLGNLPVPSVSGVSTCMGNLCLISALAAS